jgi:hypothetical protein
MGMERVSDETVRQLAAYPLPTCEELVRTTAKVNGKTVTCWPQAERLLFPCPEFRCVGCGRPLTGIFGYFRWGLANGEGYCSECGWPARGAHDVTVEGGGEETATIVLQYMPDELVELLDRDAFMAEVSHVG